MPERLAQIAADRLDAIWSALLFAFFGILFTIGEMLKSKEVLTARIVIGRCLSTAGLAMSAGLVLLAFPGAPFLAQIGTAAAIGALGTSGLERIIQRILGTGRRG